MTLRLASLPVDLVARFRVEISASVAPLVAGPIGVAVSGGPDSLALLLLCSLTFPAGIAAATVDHGLRPAAATEAAEVSEACARLGVPHAILVGDVRGRGSAQDRARRLRYELLGQWAADAGLAAIATAHHADDQAETFLMRAARGAGVAGLAGVRKQVALAGVPVIRPLLGWRRAELVRVVAAAGLAAADDPSNRDPAYDRTAFRTLLAATPLLPPQRLAAAAGHLADAEEAIGWIVDRIAGERLVDVAGATRLVDPASLPRELRRRLLRAAIDRVGGARVVRGDALDRLLRLLDSGCAGTLAGVQARPGRDWRFSPAPPRDGRGRNQEGSPGACIAINPEPLI